MTTRENGEKGNEFTIRDCRWGCSQLWGEYPVNDHIATGNIIFPEEYQLVRCDVLVPAQWGMFQLNEENAEWTYIPNCQFEGRDLVEILLIDHCGRDCHFRLAFTS